MQIQQRPVLAQQQQLKLSPRMLQAIRLLALPLQELTEQIHQELEENPALELLSDSGEVSLDVMEASIDTIKDSDDNLREAEYSDDAFGFNGEENDRSAIIEQTIATEESLQDHLLGQLGLLPLREEERRIAERIIQNTDENGFHLLSPSEVCANCDEETLARILSLLQRLDPPGTCTSDYRESLIVQAEIASSAPPKTIEVLSRHFENLQSRNHSTIKKALGLDDRQLDRIIEFIKTLNPYPGRIFSKARPRYIVADLAMWLEDGEIKVRLNDETVPKLGINRLYTELAARSTRGEAEKFARERVENAHFFINSIKKRNETLLKTAFAIAEAQKDFFTAGPKSLKPLALKEIAEKIGVHEATVSRVVNGKYVQTDWGTFELRRFFTNAVNPENGENISKEGAKAEVLQIIGELESKGEKISDRIIAETLARRGINVARRTVAKYRSELGK
ncbi:MAG: RNA polymerase factor sigma-54 [Rectinema sp.]